MVQRCIHGRHLGAIFPLVRAGSISAEPGKVNAKGRAPTQSRQRALGAETMRVVLLRASLLCLLLHFCPSPVFRLALHHAFACLPPRRPHGLASCLVRQHVRVSLPPRKQGRSVSFPLLGPAGTWLLTPQPLRHACIEPISRPVRVSRALPGAAAGGTLHLALQEEARHRAGDDGVRSSQFAAVVQAVVVPTTDGGSRGDACKIM